jgi:hypothetical protein
LRAYALWQREGQPEGHAERHWQEAKAAIAAEEATQNIDARMSSLVIMMSIRPQAEHRPAPTKTQPNRRASKRSHTGCRIEQGHPTELAANKGWHILQASASALQVEHFILCRRLPIGDI